MLKSICPQWPAQRRSQRHGTPAKVLLATLASASENHKSKQADEGGGTEAEAASSIKKRGMRKKIIQKLLPVGTRQWHATAAAQKNSENEKLVATAELETGRSAG